MVMAAVPLLAVSNVNMATVTQAYLATMPIRESNVLFTELRRQFLSLGWVSVFTGGSLAIKVHRHSVRKLQQVIVIPPAGVLKKIMEPDDMYVP